mmetsp:Transcript_14483/g.48549  ORF Transcript_14483/g.48549 Transcript_14483/m.48549 type:complete len:221 (-) Transcript_14483:736-1398(-)
MSYMTRFQLSPVRMPKTVTLAAPKSSKFKSGGAETLNAVETLRRDCLRGDMVSQENFVMPARTEAAPKSVSLDRVENRIFAPVSSSNRSSFAKKDMPAKVKMKVKRMSRTRKGPICCAVSTMVLNSTCSDFQFLASLKIRKTRAHRSAETAPPPKLNSNNARTIEIMPMITIVPSKQLKESAVYIRGPMAATLRTISAMKTSESAKLIMDMACVHDAGRG